MSKDNIIKLIQPGNVDDQLTEILRNGARVLLAQAVEAEVADFLGKHADLKTADGHQRVVRHGHLPEREVMTGIGPIAVRQPRVRDREADASAPDRIRFAPSILPPYMRRSKSIETLLPILYLKGISTGDFSEALAALLGKDAAGLSASAIGRLKDGWLDEHTAWQRRDLSAKRYVYIWADGIHLQARLEDEKQCILVLIGATPEGRKELVGFTDGARDAMRPSKTPAKDRRIHKTRDLLHRALAALIREKPYDSISVREILDRADVGRSTFYTHFRDKDELLVSAIHDLLRSVQSDRTPSSAKLSERMISFSLPIFEHIDHHRRTGEAGMGAEGRALLHDRLREVLAELIADDLAKSLAGPRKTASQIPSRLLVEYLSSTFVLVLNWWVESRSRLSPRDVNDLFRALALPTLATVGL